MAGSFDGGLARSAIENFCTAKLKHRAVCFFIAASERQNKSRAKGCICCFSQGLPLQLSTALRAQRRVSSRGVTVNLGHLQKELLSENASVGSPT